MILAIKILIATLIVSVIAIFSLLITFYMMIKDIKNNKDEVISEQLKEILNRL
jgi:heme/copper-type cytochrome/quinol oxidase subunit 3